MCLLRVNELTVSAITELTRVGDNKSQMCEKRLAAFAAEANEKNAGPFDNPSDGLVGMPAELKHIRHYRFGKASRHRIYLSGSHKNCYYCAWCVKSFKKNDKDEENTKAFQRKLTNALNSQQKYQLILNSETENYDYAEMDGDLQITATPNPPTPPK